MRKLNMTVEDNHMLFQFDLIQCENRNLNKVMSLIISTQFLACWF